MYSLKFQLLGAVVIAAVGGAVAAVYFSDVPLLSFVIVALAVASAYGILFVFIYRPVQKYLAAVRSQHLPDPVQRVMVESSDEFLRLSDAMNTLFESFRRDIARMKKLERVRTEFLGSVSHELRTPIFSTQGLIETLLNGAIDDKKVNRDFLQRALINTERLNTLLEELIDISRIESGEMKLQFRFFDIIPFLRSVVDEMRGEAEKRSITLRLTGGNDGSLEVYGDRERLRHVMENLINNAIKYSEPGDQVCVYVKDFKERVEISVEDTGIGIAPHHIPRIFERFYRVDRDRSRDVGGTGLGLAIVKHIVEAHDAEISVVSEVGIGSTFTFWVNKHP